MLEPSVACLVPTFRRPSPLIANAIACFEAQTYPWYRRRLIVVDDSNTLESQHGRNWSIIPLANRFESLPQKYNVMVDMARDADIICVWEDDDVYLPQAVENHVKALKYNSWSHPSRVWSLYTGKLEQESANGRFHASLAMRREVAKWVETDEANFDQQLMTSLQENHGEPGDPCYFGLPSYVFRWGSTESPHGQAFMRGSRDTEWYDRAGREMPIPERDGLIVPKLDEETASVYAQIAAM